MLKFLTINTKNVGKITIRPVDVHRIVTPSEVAHLGCVTICTEDAGYVVFGTHEEWIAKLGLPMLTPEASPLPPPDGSEEVTP